MGVLKVQLEGHLELARLILFGGGDAAKGCCARVGIGRGETHVVKSVERLETVLQPEALAHLEVLEYSGVEGVDAAGAHDGPAGGIGADEGREVVIDAVLDSVTGGRLILVTWAFLNG